jgi:diadenosine tetraphosphate (Ap4A) HIT family hydrolase
MDDANYPWFILVPDRANITEIFQLDEIEQQQLITESSLLSRTIASEFNADKINIAALGNLVPQLHIHHIVRYTSDAAWPAPVWGKLLARPYIDDEANQIINRLQPGLGESFKFEA